MLNNDIRLASFLENAKEFYQQGYKKEHRIHLLIAINLIANIKSPKESLMLEAICIDIYDTNFVRSNINKINNKLASCFTAIKEWNLFKNNKEQYIKEFKATRIKDINADSIFEKSVKEIIRYLGSEKNTILVDKIIKDFLETRQNKLKNIMMDFTKEKIKLLSKSFTS